MCLVAFAKFPVAPLQLYISSYPFLPCHTIIGKCSSYVGALFCHTVGAACLGKKTFLSQILLFQIPVNLYLALQIFWAL